MSSGQTSLPAGFEALEPFAATWAIDNGPARAEARAQGTAEDRRAFYEAASPLLAQALDHLDGKPLTELDESEQRLMHMMLSFAHVAIAEEVQKGDEERHAYYRTFMPVTRVPADF